MKYLEGRGGRDRTLSPDEAEEDVRRTMRDVVARIEVLEGRIKRAEEVMLWIRRALLRTQPSMYGRLDIRWWRGLSSGKYAWRTPVLVKQAYGPGGRLKVEVAPQRMKRAPRGGAFDLNADLADRMIEAFREVAKIRDRMRRDVMGLVRILGWADLQWERHQEQMLVAMEAEAREVYLEAVRRMQAEGYAVEAEDFDVAEGGCGDEAGEAGDEAGGEPDVAKGVVVEW